MLLTMMWEEVDRPIKEAPSMALAKVQRIDASALVIENGVQEGLMTGLLLSGGCLMMVIVFAVLWAARSHIPQNPIEALVASVHGAELVLVIAVVVLLAVAIGVLLWLSVNLLNRSLIQPSPSPIVFDRCSGKICGSHMGKPVELEWKKVKPILTQSLLLASGAQRFYNLVFFQPETPEAWAGKGRHRGSGIIVTSGQPWGWAACQALAEFIRRYMEELPENAAEYLPLVEVVSADEEQWITKVLDRGPYNELCKSEGRMERLRQRDGWPEINFGDTIWLMTLLAPGLVMTLLQVHMRKVAQLPSDWWPAPAKGESPYATITSRPEDIALRRKAAKTVAIWLGVCVTVGVALWATVFTIAIRSL